MLRKLRRYISWETILISIVLIFQLIYYIVKSYRLHLNYCTAYDLSIYSQVSWLVSHFQIPYSSIRDLNQLGDHFSPVYIFLSLGYSFINSPLYLFIIQSLSVVIGGIPVYLVSRRETKSTAVSILILISYFWQLGITSAVSNDFHLATLSVGFVSWTIYFWYRQKKIPYFIMLILSILVKEDISFLFIFFSIYLLFIKQYKYGLPTFILCTFWLFLELKYVMPFFLGGPYQFADVLSYSNIGLNYSVKLQTLWQILRQNLTLSIWHPLGLAFLTANIISRFISTVPERWQAYYQYGVNIAAPLSISLALTIGKYKKYLPKLFIMTVIVGLTYIYPQYSYNCYYPIRESDVKDLNQAISKIDQNGSVTAQEIILPHLANRKSLYLLSSLADIHTDYIIFVPNFFLTNLKDKNLFSRDLVNLEQNPDYQLTKFGIVYLFSKK